MDAKRDRIFISYRRSDAAGTTTALRKTLVERFQGQLFHDVTGISLGTSFPETLREQLDRAAVVLAVIGEGWLGAQNEFHQRRIDFPDDWVNLELSTALSNPQVVVIPVLIDNATMPPAKALPTELAELAARNAVHIRHDAWDETASQLLTRIEQVLKAGSTSETKPPDAVTLDIVRRAVTEAIDSRSPQAGQVLLATIDEISRILAGAHNTVTIDSKQTVNFLLNRLIGRKVVQVAGYMKEIFIHKYAVTASKGNWLAYALRQESRSHGHVYYDCILLLPGNDGKVEGACLARDVTWDFYGMPSNNGLPYVSIDLIGGVGIDFGHIEDTFPPKIPEAFRDADGQQGN